MANKRKVKKQVASTEEENKGMPTNRFDNHQRRSQYRVCVRLRTRRRRY